SASRRVALGTHYVHRGSRGSGSASLLESRRQHRSGWLTQPARATRTNGSGCDGDGMAASVSEAEIGGASAGALGVGRVLGQYVVHGEPLTPFGNATSELSARYSFLAPNGENLRGRSLNCDLVRFCSTRMAGSKGGPKHESSKLVVRAWCVGLRQRGWSLG